MYEMKPQNCATFSTASCYTCTLLCMTKNLGKHVLERGESWACSRSSSKYFWDTVYHYLMNIHDD